MFKRLFVKKKKKKKKKVGGVMQYHHYVTGEETETQRGYTLAPGYSQ